MVVLTVTYTKGKKSMTIASRIISDIYYELQLQTASKVIKPHLQCTQQSYVSMQSLRVLMKCVPYEVFVFISIASHSIFLLEPTSSYTVAGSVCELSLCDDFLDLLEM